MINEAEAQYNTSAAGSVAERSRLRMSYDEWHAWLGADERNRGEWVDGEVIVFAMPKYLHQAILLWLARLIAEYVELLNLGEVAVDGTEMWLAGRQTARLPDLFFVASARLGQLNADRLDGPANLVVEIISEDSVTRDRREKFLEYQAAGIPEYWIIDPRPKRQSVSCFALDASRQCQPIPQDKDGHLHSLALPGFWLNPDWLWQEPRPRPRQALAEIMAEQGRVLS